MPNIHLGMPEYVENELEERGIDVIKAMCAIFSDNQSLIELFSTFIQSEDGSKILQKQYRKGYIAFCLEDKSSLVFGCVFIQNPETGPTQLDIKISPFSKDTKDSHEDIIDAILSGELWTLFFQYDTLSNEASNMQVNWDIILNTDLKAMVNRFVKAQNSHQLH